ncbi:MAG: hypothetical protein ACREFJ_01075 [Acetobacteraceae bacterium]
MRARDDDGPCGSVRRYAIAGPWAAIHVESARSLRMGLGERARITAALGLAERLGAEAVAVPGQNVAATIIAYARANNSTHIIIANPRRFRWLAAILGSVTEHPRLLLTETGVGYRLQAADEAEATGAV